MRWYTIRARAAGAAPEVQIHGEIGLGGITVADFSRDLKGLGEPKAITVGINSLGGAVFDGIAIHNILARHPAKVTVRVDGIAASVASLIAMAADQVVMPENAFMMIHDPWAGVVGDAEDLRAMADVMDKVKQAMVAGYARKSGKAEAEIARLMAEETWLTAAEAVAMGFAGEVMQPVKIAALGNLERYPKAPAALRAAERAGTEAYAAEFERMCDEAFRDVQAKFAGAIHEARRRGFSEAEISAAIDRGLKLKLPHAAWLELIRDPGRSWH